jgi:hypothetical protein
MDVAQRSDFLRDPGAESQLRHRAMGLVDPEIPPGALLGESVEPATAGKERYVQRDIQGKAEDQELRGDQTTAAQTDKGEGSTRFREEPAAIRRSFPD